LLFSIPDRTSRPYCPVRKGLKKRAANGSCLPRGACAGCFNGIDYGEERGLDRKAEEIQGAGHGSFLRGGAGTFTGG
jgi:hypothetical protein